ncbi:MAG: hypothetical protein QOC71_1812 [Thermoplasmata archaeon]|nr:hypothetical protein [Thermoplasmata archaeon]
MSLRSFEEDLFSGKRDANLRFSRMRAYLVRLGFHERVEGSHHLFLLDGMERPLNLQELDRGASLTRSAKSARFFENDR